ncbi:replication-relaxation family protein [Streptomyces sp. NPDC004561]
MGTCTSRWTGCPRSTTPLGGGEAVIPDVLVYYRSRGTNGDGGSMLRAFVEFDRATMRPERLAAKLGSYRRFHAYAPQPIGRRPTLDPAQEDWRHRYPLFPRLLFVLYGTGPAGVETRINALHEASQDPAAALLRTVPVMAAPLTGLLHHGPAAPIWHSVQNTNGAPAGCAHPAPDLPSHSHTQ